MDELLIIGAGIGGLTAAIAVRQKGVDVEVYEPGPGGKLTLVAAEWFVPLSPDVKTRPQLFGKPFDGPMEGHHPLMPGALHHYDLHVWLWKDNPAGMFAPTNPAVKCPPKDPYTLEEVSPRIVPHAHK